MINWITKKLVGSKNQRDIRRYEGIVQRINAIENSVQSLSDDEIKAKTAGWKAHLSKITDDKQLETELAAILPEAFALVKTAATRLVGKEFTVSGRPMKWNMVHFDVQLIGGIVLHNGRIAEMATGEGKTLVATLSAYLNALSGRGVHVVTVNDYLAKRDAEWMSPLYSLLGLTVGVLQNEQSTEVRREQYQCDITYGTNSEFGFDYLRDNGMAISREEQVQRGHNYAIVDEVDSILIDEARTPLIISGPATVSTHQFDKFKPMVEKLVKQQTALCTKLVSDIKGFLSAGDAQAAGRALLKLKWGQPKNPEFLRMMEDPELRKLMDKVEDTFFRTPLGKAAMVSLKEELLFTVEDHRGQADLMEKGRTFLSPLNPNTFVMPDLLAEFADIDSNTKLNSMEKVTAKLKAQERCDAQAESIQNITQLLRAYCLYEKDVEYVVEDNKVIIVDTFTGRKMPGRRWNDGLHQAVEAKEGVSIDKETQTLATITIQNYFRLYSKLSGMTGTAETEASEFHDIYGLDVNTIPTNKPVCRLDTNDKIYKTRRAKYQAAIEEVRAAHGRGQPVLLGTISVEASEMMSRMLKQEKIAHTVLNAKQHKQEAEIVARAGMKGAVTIATNMAGRGTDIKLGDGVQELGGLYVIGTERHESRRIDRQLRGRCARQGDPGMSCFYVSFEDDLMRNFGASDQITRVLEAFGLEESKEIQHPWLNRTVETAQKKVENRNYLARRRTLEFDDVMNQQREVIYSYRSEIMDAEDPRALIVEVVETALPKKVEEFLSSTIDGAPDTEGLLLWVNKTFPLRLTKEKAAFETRTAEETSKLLIGMVLSAYEFKAKIERPDALKGLERYIILSAVDRLWQEHLYAMDSLREAVALRAFAQKTPLVEYKNDAFAMFVGLMDSIKAEALTNLFRSTTNLMAFEKFLSTLPQHLECETV